MSMHGKTRILATMVVMSMAASMPMRAQDPESLREFDGTFNFAWVGAKKGRHLDVGTSDFLIAFRANTKEITRSNLPDMGIVCKKPFGNQPGYALLIDRKQTLHIDLNDSVRESQGKAGYACTVSRFFTPGT